MRMNSHKPRTCQTLIATVAILMLSGAMLALVVHSGQRASSNETIRPPKKRFYRAVGKATASQRAKRLARAEFLREKWRPWALHNKELIENMLKSQPADQNALMVVWNAVPALPPTAKDVEAGALGLAAEDLAPVDDPAFELQFSWNPIVKVSQAGTDTAWGDDKTQSNEASSAERNSGCCGNQDKKTQEEMEKHKEMVKQIQMSRMQKQFSAFHDFVIADSGWQSPLVALWVSGRITEFSRLPPEQVARNQDPFSGPHRELMPPYDFLVKSKSTKNDKELVQ